MIETQTGQGLIWGAAQQCTRYIQKLMGKGESEKNDTTNGSSRGLASPVRMLNTPHGILTVGFFCIISHELKTGLEYAVNLVLLNYLKYSAQLSLTEAMIPQWTIWRCSRGREWQRADNIMSILLNQIKGFTSPDLAPVECWPLSVLELLATWLNPVELSVLVINEDLLFGLWTWMHVNHFSSKLANSNI